MGISVETAGREAWLLGVAVLCSDRQFFGHDSE